MLVGRLGCSHQKIGVGAPVDAAAALAETSAASVPALGSMLQAAVMAGATLGLASAVANPCGNLKQATARQGVEWADVNWQRAFVAVLASAVRAGAALYGLG